MTGFKLQTSCVRRNDYANCAENEFIVKINGVYLMMIIHS